jgi:hypothetical protein
MSSIARTIGLIAMAGSLGGCWGAVSEHPAAQYVHRSDTITLSAGDAKEVNAATHAIDPWPPGVGDPRIRANGERMAGAAERYRRNGQRTDSPAGQQAPSAAGTAGMSPLTSGPSPSGDRATLPY